MDALALKLTSFSQSGGCGCKIDPTALHQILEKVPKHWAQPDLLVGIENNDDAAVMRISEHESLIFSSDFSTPIVDDPYTYGRTFVRNVHRRAGTDGNRHHRGAGNRRSLGLGGGGPGTERRLPQHAQLWRFPEFRG